VLTTNKPAALDPALRRRLSLQLHLDPPEARERERLWRSLIPPRAPLAPDVDFARLARIELTGGYIKNIALRAAFQARAGKRPITMSLLERCIALELEDLGRVVLVTEPAPHHTAVA
jgi:SpoVK/Ycf46/Vps4 family AAA+-type ATPase